MLCYLMQFPIKIGKRWQVQIPKTVREYLSLKEGDQVLMEITKKDSIEDHKRNVEKLFRRE
jgi:AbrB family looped-hinge helix DNA binding protein